MRSTGCVVTIEKVFLMSPMEDTNRPSARWKRCKHFRLRQNSQPLNARILKKTFKETMKGDVIYCDPPYVPLSVTSSFTSYSKDDFDLRDQSRLAKSAIASQSSGIRCVISNHDLDVTRKMYEMSDIHEISVQRNIASKSSSRKKIKEIIAVF